MWSCCLRFLATSSCDAWWASSVVRVPCPRGRLQHLNFFQGGGAAREGSMCLSISEALSPDPAGGGGSFVSASGASFGGSLTSAKGRGRSGFPRAGLRVEACLRSRGSSSRRAYGASPSAPSKTQQKMMSQQSVLFLAKCVCMA